MKKRFLFFVTLLSFRNAAEAQITTDNTITPAQMVQNVLLGSGVTASNVTYTGYVNGIAKFNATPSTNLGFSSGIYLTTGSCLTNAGNNQGGPGGPYTNFQNIAQNVAGDPDLDTLLQQLGSGATTNDAAVLEFDFIPLSDTVKFRYRFGSEEYNDYVNSPFNDVFGFFLSGVSTPLPKVNIALIPGTNTPVTINSVNNGYSTAASAGPCNYCAYYDDNFDSGVDVVYDGITNALTAIYPVTCGQTYHIKLAIADVNDKSYDSGVFLEAGSFTSQPPVTITASIADSVITEDCGTTILYFVRPQTQTANPITYHYTISGTATNGVDYTPALPDSIVFPAGQDSVWINITALNDGLAEPLESLTLSLNNVTICGIQVVISFDLHIKDYTPLSTQSTNDTTICIGQSAHIGMTVNEGVPSYAFSWTTNGTNAGNTQALTVTPLSNAWYIANVTDACNKHIKDSIYITVLNNPPLLQDLLPVNACIGRLVEIPTNVTGGINNTYTWNTISGNDSVHQLNPLMAELTYPTIPGNYALVVTNKCGQFDTDTLHIHVEDCTVIYPNIITPNHDGKNDALYFANLDKYPNTALWVYNRWGNKIYESDNYPNNWIPDVSDGTYYYILKFADKTTHSSFVQVSK